MSLSRSRPRFQLTYPMKRFSRISFKPGKGAGLRCASERCAIVKVMGWSGAPARQPPRARPRTRIALISLELGERLMATRPWRQDRPRRDRPRRSLVELITMRLALLSFLVTRPMTLGVRGIVLDAASAVMLVRHSYVPGWHLPGGGGEAGQPCEAAPVRELHEEANVIVEGPAILHGLFFHPNVS